MSLRWNQTVYTNVGQITTATTDVIMTPIDISSFEVFALSIQNNHSAIGVLNLDVQVAMDPSANLGATGAPNWVSIPTATLPLPSAVGGSGALPASSTYMTSAILNSYHWLRIRAGMSATATGDFRVTVGGFTRR